MLLLFVRYVLSLPQICMSYKNIGCYSFKASHPSALRGCYLWGPGELSEGVGVRDKSKAAAAAHHVLDVHVEIVSEVTKNRKDGDTGK